MAHAASYIREYKQSKDKYLPTSHEQARSAVAAAARDGTLITREFIERHCTGTARPLFISLVRSIDEGAFDRIYTYSIDRLIRTKREAAIFRRLLRIGKLKFIKTRRETFLKNSVQLAPPGLIAEGEIVAYETADSLAYDADRSSSI